MLGSLPVINLERATFECTYGRGCEGSCCRNGRPSVTAAEQERIDVNLHKFLPHLRAEARLAIDEDGYLSRRRKRGVPMMRVIEGWCVFFNGGCILHKIGAAEGDKHTYKPIVCSLFPLAQDERGRWFVRQHGYKSEIWDLVCLCPATSAQPARHALEEEMTLALEIHQKASEKWQTAVGTQWQPATMPQSVCS